MAMHSFHTYTSAYIYMLLHVRAPFYVYACSMRSYNNLRTLRMFAAFTLYHVQR